MFLEITYFLLFVIKRVYPRFMGTAYIVPSEVNEYHMYNRIDPIYP